MLRISSIILIPSFKMNKQTLGCEWMRGLKKKKKIPRNYIITEQNTTIEQNSIKWFLKIFELDKGKKTLIC